MSRGIFFGLCLLLPRSSDHPGALRTRLIREQSEFIFRVIAGIIVVVRARAPIIFESLRSRIFLRAS